MKVWVKASCADNKPEPQAQAKEKKHSGAPKEVHYAYTEPTCEEEKGVEELVRGECKREGCERSEFVVFLLAVSAVPDRQVTRRR